MKTLAFFTAFLILVSGLSARNPEKKAMATRVEKAPRIDGKIDDAEWGNATPIKDFTQFVPNYNIAPTHPTEVRIVFNDEAVFVAALMYDNSPDSIFHQLGNRDDDNLNADNFGIAFDTYDNELDAYVFRVSASGVQGDQRMQDDTYNAVWECKVCIDELGWTLEMRIPYSAVRFPKKPIQQWGMQIVREMRHNREAVQWALEEKGVPNPQKYWGTLEGIKDIEPPMRLSVTPYLSTTISSTPGEGETSQDISKSLSGGMDLKYGLNESFTLDVTLLPDFSQVQSDNEVKNLSAFETVYDEQRPFFQEAFDLFSKGDLFYTRRIGRIPLNYYEVEDQLQEGEKIRENPVAAKLINATKFSGRNRKGLGIGFFNAITNNTYAIIEDSAGNTRKYLSDPMTNYNILVLDQALKNNSSAYIINTNVTRDNGFNNANVTGSGLELYNKNNTYGFEFNAALSQIFEKNSSNGIESNTTGLKYDFEGGKTKGKFQFLFYQSLMDDKFSANDMGITFRNNEFINKISFYLNQYEPKNGFRESSLGLSYSDWRQFTSGVNLKKELRFEGYGNTMNYLSLFGGAEFELSEAYDFYEPRTEGMYYLKPKYSALFSGFSSDYRKTFALDGNFTYVISRRDDFDMYEFRLMPLVRVNDKLFFTYEAFVNLSYNDIGFANSNDEGDPIFGNRHIVTVSNTFNIRYLFRNNLSLTMRLRHYNSDGDYDQYFDLNPDGSLSPNDSYTDNNDFNFNAFNIDLVFNWEFAPGSQFNIIWKNAVKDEVSYSVPDYGQSFQRTWETPQSNTFTIKVLYYLDYLYLRKNKK